VLVNIIAPGGAFETGQQQVILNPSGQFQNINAIGEVAVSTSSVGAPVYLRDLVEISRGYQSPAQYVNYYTWGGSEGLWLRSRSVYTCDLHARPAADRDVRSICRPETCST